MIDFDFDDFIKSGRILDFTRDSTEADIEDVFGFPDEIEDYGVKGKYLHYSNLRFSVFDGRLNFFDVHFFKTDFVGVLKLGPNAVDINGTTTLNKLLYYLNQLRIKWCVPNNNYDIDYVTIELSNGLRIYHFLESDTLDRISQQFNPR